MNRRRFLAIAGGSVVAATLAACAEPATIPTSARITIDVGDFPGLATLGTLVKVGSTHAAKRTGTDTFVAYSMYCTHAGCATSLSGSAPAQKFVCPCHGSQFDANGNVTQGPAGSPLHELPTMYDLVANTLTIN